MYMAYVNHNHGGPVSPQINAWTS